MSRNKTILLLIILGTTFVLIPGTPQGLYIKELMIQLTTYVLVFMLVYLAITINLLKRSFKRLFENPDDENTLRAAKLLRVSFDIKRSFGVGTLKSLFNHVNASKNVSMEAKEELYNAIKRKRVDIPPPAMAKRSK